MKTEELVDELNIHADTNNRMIHLFNFVEENRDLNPESLITLLQTAFWAGVEAVQDQEFREKVANLYLNS